jgi:hypothetical protein
MKLGPPIASATFVFAFCQCGPLVNDPPLDGGSGTTSGNSGAGANTGSTSGSAAGASMSGSTTGTASGTTGSATGASGASSGATTGGDMDSATSDTDSASSGSSAGSSGTSGGGGPDATMQGDNLVLNGDFSQGGTYWGISSGTGGIDAGTNAGTSQLCVTVGMGSGTVYLGWPQPSSMVGMSLASGTMYTFSYKAQTAQGNLTIEAKVANSMGSSNYMPVDSDSTMDMVTGSLQTFTHTFTPTSNDASAGVVFIFSSQSADTVCFESVSVVAQ